MKKKRPPPPEGSEGQGGNLTPEEATQLPSIANRKLRRRKNTAPNTQLTAKPNIAERTTATPERRTNPSGQKKTRKKGRKHNSLQSKKGKKGGTQSRTGYPTTHTSIFFI